jgi:dUTPase
VFLPGATTNISFNWKLKLPPCHFGLLMPLNQQAKKRITVLGGVIDPDYHGEIGSTTTMKVKGIMSGVQEIP